MKIIAIRHGQTELYAERRVQGCKSDLPLNEEGRKQACEKISFDDMLLEIGQERDTRRMPFDPLDIAVVVADLYHDSLYTE